ncbi:LexA family protein [Modicisalibacter xianhensis]|uniref:DNA polymerase V n=1 Tax=Modicisalibacter xianhensis TaxID=442341 RepID=A0A1I2ZBQ1_9GAMM|nr:translesion error-prone DNA polymerase V autoproteolytic subunit [Halomonas xianhensis]TDX26986.1 DNA polymerase V [Halomonas xianhensis]SFH34956.1 SOS response UmuD protein. Serine peptidase. MEROPS family S24 [Halomonas xianhensis]
MSPLIPAEAAPPPLALPFPETLIRAGLSGFPSPAQDYEGRTLDLNERLIKRPSATFFMQVVDDGDSMLAYGIYPGDILVVDRSIDPRPGHILAALVDGEVIVKRYELLGNRPYLCSGNTRYAPIPLGDTECQVWGVVRSVIHEFPV